MRNFSMALVFCFVSLAVMGQTKSIKSFYNKYKRYEEVTSVKMQGWVIRLAAKFTDDKDAKKVMRQISKLRVLTMENGNLVSPKDYHTLIQHLKKDDFEVLLKIREGGQTIDFYAREKDDTISDLLLLVNGQDEFVMISLEGQLRFEDIRNLTIDAEGSEHFEKIPIKQKAEKEKVPRA